MRRGILLRTAALIIAVCVLTCATSTPAAVADEQSSWRIAAGFDNGVSVRANLYRGWGVGLHYQYNGSSRIIGSLLGFPEQWNEYGLIVFGDYPLFERVSMGPFAEFILARDNISDFDTEAYGVIFGIRPAVRLLSDRFLLETRFGMQIIRMEDLPFDDGHEIFATPGSNEWTIGLHGENIGLNSRLTFMILF